MAKKQACPSCGLAFLKGRYVWRLLGDGPVRQRVCQPCAALAVPVLASDAQARCEGCGTNLARFCHGCIGKVWSAATGGIPMPEAMAAATSKRRGRARKVSGIVDYWTAAYHSAAEAGPVHCPDCGREACATERASLLGCRG